MTYKEVQDNIDQGFQHYRKHTTFCTVRSSMFLWPFEDWIYGHSFLQCLADLPSQHYPNHTHTHFLYLNLFTLSIPKFTRHYALPINPFICFMWTIGYKEWGCLSKLRVSGLYYEVHGDYFLLRWGYRDTSVWVCRLAQQSKFFVTAVRDSLTVSFLMSQLLASLWFKLGRKHDHIANRARVAVIPCSAALEPWTIWPTCQWVKQTWNTVSHHRYRPHVGTEP
jgi:hypothetical protein